MIDPFGNPIYSHSSPSNPAIALFSGHGGTYWLQLFAQNAIAITSTESKPYEVWLCSSTSLITPRAFLPAIKSFTPQVYTQLMRFSPRDDIGDVPLGYNGEGKTTTLVWQVTGAKSLALEITAVPGVGIFQNCPAGNLATIWPNDAAGTLRSLSVPSGAYQVTIPDKGYDLFTIHVVKTDGSTTTIPRNVIVDCYKTQGP